MSGQVDLKYRTERCDWQSHSITANVVRTNVKTSANGRGYEFRLRLENKRQNSRLILRGLRCQVRQQTRGDTAET